MQNNRGDFIQNIYADEKIPWQCHPAPLRGLMKTNSDFIVCIGERSFPIEIMRQRNKIAAEVKSTHNIAEGSCTAAIVGVLKNSISIDEFVGHVSYRDIETNSRLKGWTAKEIRKGIEELEIFGFLKTMTARDMPVEAVAELIHVAREANIPRSKFLNRKVALIKAHIPDTAFGPPEPGETPDAISMRNLKEGEPVSLTHNQKILGRLDLRDIPLAERDEAILRFYDEVTRVLKDEVKSSTTTTREQRIAIARQTASLAAKMAHIASVEIGGSVAKGRDHEKSDMDLIMVRRCDCPGYEQCGKTLQGESSIIDLFCFTTEERKAADREMLVVANGAKMLYKRPS